MSFHSLPTGRKKDGGRRRGHERAEAYRGRGKREGKGRKRDARQMLSAECITSTLQLFSFKKRLGRKGGGGKKKKKEKKKKIDLTTQKV